MPIHEEKDSKASRVGSQAAQFHSKVGRAIEYVGTKLMDPEEC